MDGERVGAKSGGLTIGQLAHYAGVTIKAVRHYHRRGLLAEPPRDASGYRRYDAGHAIQLLKIRTLADAGVPLAAIKELLAADPDRFAAAIAEIDRTLEARLEHLRRTRERVAQLNAGDRLFVSAEVADFLQRLGELGVSQRCLQMERDIWILMHAVSPTRVVTWIAEKREAMADPEFRAMYLECDAAFDWSADDPRLYALADRMRRWTANRRIPSADGERASAKEQAISQLVAMSAGTSSPGWDRLMEIVASRTMS